MSTKKKKGEREKKNNEKGQRQTGIQGERQRYLQRKREREIESERKTDRKKRTKGIEDIRKELSIKCLFCKEKIWERLIKNI